MLTLAWYTTVAYCHCRNYEDAYTDPGSPATRRTSSGSYVLALVDDERKLLLQGAQFRPCLPLCLLVVFAILHHAFIGFSGRDEGCQG
jgi:hypothetical protein